MIFVGASGEQVYASLTSLIRLLGIAEPPSHCIGIMRVEGIESKKAQTAEYWFLSDDFTPGRSTSARMEDVHKATSPTIENALEQLRLEVLSYNNWQFIREKGYDIIDEKPLQVYIVGGPTNAVLGRVLKIVHEQMPTAEISYVLCPDPPTRHSSPPKATSQIGSQIPSSNALSNEKQHVIPNFCYLYENYNNVPLELCYYAAAQALYALLITSVAALDEFSEAIASTSAHNNSVQSGTMSTCLITSPYEAGKICRDFCDTYLAGELITSWRRDQGAFKDPNDNADPASLISQEQAEMSQAIAEWKNDSLVFLPPNIQEVWAEYSPSNKTFAVKQWASSLKALNDKRYTQWKAGVIAARQKQYQNIRDLWQITLQKLWLSYDKGPEVAKAYLDFVKEQIVEFATSLANEPVSLSKPEENIREHLMKELKEHYEQIPAKRTHITISLAMLVVTLLMLVTLLPSWLVLLPAAVITVSIYIAVNMLYARHYKKQMSTIQTELINYYDVYYHYHCAQFEYDLLTQEYNERINEMINEIESKQQGYIEFTVFTTALQRRWQEKAWELKEQFFNRLTASYDMYLSYGVLLLRVSNEDYRGATTLENFASTIPVPTLMRDVVRAKWNEHSSAWIKKDAPQLIVNDSAMNLNEDEVLKAWQEISKLVQSITEKASIDNSVGLYNLNQKESLSLTPTKSSTLIVNDVSNRRTDIADLSDLEMDNITLSDEVPLVPDSQIIWRYIREQRLKPLVRFAASNPVPSYIFLCGKAEHLKGVPHYIQTLLPKTKVVIVDIEMVTGVLVAAIYRDSIPPISQLSTLFPEKGQEE